MADTVFDNDDVRIMGDGIVTILSVLYRTDRKRILEAIQNEYCFRCGRANGTNCACPAEKG